MINELFVIDMFQKLTTNNLFIKVKFSIQRSLNEWFLSPYLIIADDLLYIFHIIKIKVFSNQILKIFLIHSRGYHFVFEIF